MFVTIDPGDARPIYVQIMDEVRRGIALGTLLQDDPLPSVRQLAAELKVNPNTVKQAYRELERDGVVYVRRGQGTYIADVSTGDRQRRAFAEVVAERALRDAFRHGLSAADLVDAITRKLGDEEDAAGGNDDTAQSRRPRGPEGP